VDIHGGCPPAAGWASRSRRWSPQRSAVREPPAPEAAVSTPSGTHGTALQVGQRVDPPSRYGRATHLLRHPSTQDAGGGGWHPALRIQADSIEHRSGLAGTAGTRRAVSRPQGSTANSAPRCCCGREGPATWNFEAGPAVTVPRNRDVTKGSAGFPLLPRHGFSLRCDLATRRL